MDILPQVNLQPHNSLGVKANAQYFCEPSSDDELREALRFATEQDLSVSIIGEGSNILIATEQLPGLVIKLGIRGIEEISADQLSAVAGDLVLPERVHVRAAAGENWHQFVMCCLDRGWYGLENLALIPGSVGAAPIQNIGAYGVEQDEFCVAIEVLDRDSGKKSVLSAQDCGFSYRDSRFKHDWSQRYVILGVVYGLRVEPKPNIDYQALRDELTGAEECCTEDGDEGAYASELSDFLLTAVTPEELAAAVIRIRRRKLPDPASIPNAGSFFKNPVVSASRHSELLKQYPEMPWFKATGAAEAAAMKIPAGWLIDQLGWKGQRRGGVGVHEEHALVLVNPGGEGGQQIMQLAAEIQASVSERFGVQLHQEVRVLPA